MNQPSTTFTAYATVTASFVVGAFLLVDPVQGNPQIVVDDTQVFQEFYGCGASWTDSSAWIMKGTRNNPGSDPRSLSSTEEDEIFAALFRKDCDGCIGLDIVRQPMGTSDFRWSDYTYEDTRGTFDITRDESYIIPTIQRSITENPNLKVMALPWSAPAWAKYSNTLNGGGLTHDSTILSDYHDYFADFVIAYEGHNIPIWAVSVQNEPQHSSNDYPTMTMSAYDHGKLIQGVRAALDAVNRQNVRVIGYDHNWDTPWYVTNFLNDPNTRSAVSAVAFHCYGGSSSAQSNIKNQFPDVEIFFTECTEHGGVSSFNGDFRWALKNLVIDATRNWASTVIEWNLVLFYNGPKIYGGCSNCRGLIDVFDWGYVKNPAFYALGHLSKFLKPGAHRIHSTEPTSNSKTLAMLNTDGSSFVIILNDGWPDQTFDIDWMGASCSVYVKSWSAVTVFRASTGSATMEVWRTTDQDSSTRLKHTEDVTCTLAPGTTPSPTIQQTPPPTPQPTPPPTSQPTPAPPPPTLNPTKNPTPFPVAPPTLPAVCTQLIQQLEDDCGITV